MLSGYFERNQIVRLVTFDILFQLAIQASRIENETISLIQNYGLSGQKMTVNGRRTISFGGCVVE